MHPMKFGWLQNDGDKEKKTSTPNKGYDFPNQD